MHATVRRHEGVDESRTAELTKKVGETLMPSLSKLPGFNGYYLIAADNGIMTSIGLFETSTQASDSIRAAAEWIRGDPPKVTDGKVVARKTNGISVA
jgi:hypothetical protein